MAKGEIKVTVGGQPVKVKLDPAHPDGTVTFKVDQVTVDWAKQGEALRDLTVAKGLVKTVDYHWGGTPAGPPSVVYDADLHHCTAPKVVHDEANAWLHELRRAGWPEPYSADPEGRAWDWSWCCGELTPTCRAVGWEGEQTWACIWRPGMLSEPIWLPCPVPGPLSALKWLMEQRASSGTD